MNGNFATLNMLILCLHFLCLSACGGNGNGNGGKDLSVDEILEEIQEETGYPSGMPMIEGKWTDCPQPPPVGENPVTLKLILNDFSEDFPVANAYIDIFLGNTIDEQPDFALGPTNTNGETQEFQALPNSLIAYRVEGSTEVPFPPGEIKTSIEYDVKVPEGGGNISAIAVSRATYQLIPTVLGIPPTPGMGILAGAFTDCSGKDISGVVARLYPKDSTIPCNNEASVKCLDRYFVNETPAKDQKWSSSDGLYGILEIPPGDGYTLQLHGKLADSTCPEKLEVLGEKLNVSILPDAISIVDVSASVAEERRCVL